jgi:hypothetical protein
MGATATIAATAMQAVGALSQGMQAKNAAKYNAKLAEQNAAMARDQANADAQAQQRDARRTIGLARANYGASGVTLEGSPLDVLEQSAALAELDRQTILYKGEVRATGYGNEAALEKHRGKTAMMEGIMGAGSAIVMGYGKYNERYGKGSTQKPAPVEERRIY